MTPDPGTVAALAAEPALASLRRSLHAAYGDPARAAALDAFYSRFVRPGDLAFDVGAHVGDRTASFRRLGARVVAVEPQPRCLRALRALYRHDGGVALVGAACGAAPGTGTLRVNSANPMVSTASTGFVEAARGAPGWEGQVWDAEVETPVTTLDALLAAYGVPAFIKIDVEGLEDAVLAGLGTAVRALSFELTTIHRDAALRGLERLAALGRYGFDLSPGESLALAFGRWVPARTLAAHIRSIPYEINSGDIYCVLMSGGDGTPRTPA